MPKHSGTMMGPRRNRCLDCVQRNRGEAEMAATIVFGTEQADFLLGNNLIDPSLLYDEIFFALGGDDIVSGGLERDFVWAGSGNDTVDLGSGNDKGVGQEG